MDAKQRLFIVAYGLMVYVLGSGGGCVAPGPPPIKSRAPDPEPEASQVVRAEPAPTTQAADSVEAAIESYLARVQDASRPHPATQPAHPEELALEMNAAPHAWLHEPPPAQSQPAATQPVTTQPAAPPPATQPAEPPQLTRVVVRPAESGLLSGRPNAPAGNPGINTPVTAAGGPADLRELLQQFAGAEGGTYREQLDRRMLCVLAGEYEQARQPLTMVTAEQQELARRFVEAWIVIRDCHMGDPAAAAGAAAKELAELQQALRRVSDLSVPVVALCSAVRGFGQYELLEPPRVAAGGAEFVLYCEVRDFVTEEQGGVFTTRFDLTTAILNRSGDVVLEFKDTDLVDRCRNPRHDCFIPRLVRLPATLPPGSYTAKVTVVDRLGQKVAENRAGFQIIAR